VADCRACRSCVRFRSIVLVLSRALFGMDLELPQFPRLKSIRGLGFSDSDVYARRLEEVFSYTNTFYHREPAFDLSRPDESEFGKHDFVICSEVLEHVPSPVHRAFETLVRLLKPSGMLIATAPYSLQQRTLEHFPELRDSGLATVSGKTVLVNRTAAGNYEVFEDLAFHGGSGSTLEMRVLSEVDLRTMLESAGFSSVHFETTGNAKFGISFAGPCSLPILATKAPFRFTTSGIRELTEQWIAARGLLNAVKESRWVRLGRLVGLGPKIDDI